MWASMVGRGMLLGDRSHVVRACGPCFWFVWGYVCACWGPPMTVPLVNYRECTTQISKPREMQSILKLLFLSLGSASAAGCFSVGQACTLGGEYGPIALPAGRVDSLIWFRTWTNVCDACRVHFCMEEDGFVHYHDTRPVILHTRC